MGSIPVGSTKQKGTFSGAFLFGLFARKRPVGSRERSEALPRGPFRGIGRFPPGSFLFGLFARKRPVGSRERSEALPRGPLQGFRLIPAGLFFVWSFSLFAPYLDKST